MRLDCTEEAMHYSACSLLNDIPVRMHAACVTFSFCDYCYMIAGDCQHDELRKCIRALAHGPWWYEWASQVLALSQSL